MACAPSEAAVRPRVGSLSKALPASAVIISLACLLQRETVMLKVMNMNNQAKLYSQGFRPVFRVGQGQWQFIRWGMPVPQTACRPAHTHI